MDAKKKVKVLHISQNPNLTASYNASILGMNAIPTTASRHASDGIIIKKRWQNYILCRKMSTSIDPNPMIAITIPMVSTIPPPEVITINIPMRSKNPPNDV